MQAMPTRPRYGRCQAGATAVVAALMRESRSLSVFRCPLSVRRDREHTKAVRGHHATDNGQRPTDNDQSFVLPIRILGMLEVPQRPAAPYDRNGLEVVGRRRRGRGPLEPP